MSGYQAALDNPAISRGRKLLEVYWEEPSILSDDMWRIINELESAEDAASRMDVVDDLVERAENAHALRVEKIREIAAAITEAEGGR